MIGTGEKGKMNPPANIDNYFGKHEGRMWRPIGWLLLTIAPFLIYTISGLALYIPLKVMIIITLLWGFRTFLYIMGDEKKKMAQWKAEKNNEYATANDLIEANTHDDGLVEYTSGKVLYILQLYPHVYFNDDDFAEDLEAFFDKLDAYGYEHDEYLYNITNEYHLQDYLDKLMVYQDEEIRKERMDFYVYQDKFADENTKLYEYNIAVKTNKYNWKKMREDLEGLLQSDLGNIFFYRKICNRDEVSDVMSRDLCLFVDILEMLKEKYKSDNYMGAEVLYYGDEIPEEYRVQKDKLHMNERRVVVDVK